MKRAEDLLREVELLSDRLSKLSEASLRINESLDFDSVLQEVVDNARALTDSRYGGLTVVDESGQLQEFVTSGLSPQEYEQMTAQPEGFKLFQYLIGLPGPLRVADLSSHLRSLGLPEFHPPVDITSYLATPIRNRGNVLGTLSISKGGAGREFTREDEVVLVMFASQAAMVIANARKYRDEQRARTDLETLVNTAPVGVMVFDGPTGKLTLLNPEAERLVVDLHGPDATAEELLEVMTVRRADGREYRLDELPLARAFRDGDTVRAEEIVVAIPDGPSMHVLVNATPIFATDGEVESVVTTVQDMRPINELERLRAEFLGMVGHELRTPLTSIKGSAVTLLEGASSLDPAEMLQFHRIIDEQADYMRDLIGDLIDVVRIETGTLSVDPEPAEIARLVDEARSTFLSAGGTNNIRLALEPDLPLVMADRRRIVQVLSNLLSNASRNSHEASTVRVTAARDDVHVAVAVSDEGRGVPAERLPHLFRKFARIDGQDRGRDLGLGLAICKGIVEVHGGRIWAESDGPGLGTRFTFTIPVADETAAAGIARKSSRSSRHRKSNQMRVLAVDDDPRVLKHVRDALSNAGFEPIVTGDPDYVMALIEANDPDVVLLDQMLPGTDGIELMQEVLALYDVPVIFLSAYDQDELVARAFAMGAIDYVVKPFSPTELVARVKVALRKQREPAAPFVLGELVIDYADRSVTVAGRPAELTATEFLVLAELSTNAGVVMTHDQLLQRVWGMRGTGDARPLRTVVKLLRRKLGDDARRPKYIFSVRRVGYRMAAGDD